MNMSYIGTRIRERRKELGLTISQIAASTGISAGNLSEIETGKKLPSTPALISLSKVLCCTIDCILIEDYEAPFISNENSLSASELSLLRDFRSLPLSDQYEVHEIIKLKNKLKEGRPSSSLQNSESLLA